MDPLKEGPYSVTASTSSIPKPSPMGLRVPTCVLRKEVCPGLRILSAQFKPTFILGTVTPSFSLVTHSQWIPGVERAFYCYFSCWNTNWDQTGTVFPINIQQALAMYKGFYGSSERSRTFNLPYDKPGITT